MKAKYTPETKEQLLIRRMYKVIANHYFRDHKMVEHYCDGVRFPRQLGEDIADYIQGKNPEYYHKLRKQIEQEKPQSENI